ncbi:MAG: CHAD domain-containing protein [Phycisphaerales bacterium]|nr:CHAD domain-containing protein [Phycisphaerales bacterium]
MAFEFRLGEPVQREVRRIAGERAAKSVRAIQRAEASSVAEGVHEARRRCKELRALLRLVKPSFRGYGTENAAVRDAARGLAELRDAQTLVEALDQLVLTKNLQPDRYQSIRAMLVERNTKKSQSAESPLAAFVHEMKRFGERSKSWKLRRSGFVTLRGGLEETYAKCRHSMAEARHTPTAEALHEWRKQVKYNRAHLRLLRGLWPAILEPMREQAKQLSDMLGFDHDLAVLAEAIGEHAGETEASAELIEHIRSTRAELRREAFQLGPLLFAQSPRDYGRHAKALWVQRKVPAD